MCNIALVFRCFLIKHHWIYCVSTGSGNYAWEEMDRRDPMRLGLNQNFCELSHQNVSLNIIFSMTKLTQVNNQYPAGAITNIYIYWL